MKGSRGAGVAIAIAAWSGMGLPAWSQSAAEFYKGKQIEIIASAEAATTYDGWGRLMSRYLPKYLPGNPAVVVKNMPGAGTIKGAQYLFSVAPKDGTSIGNFSRNIPTSYALKEKSIDFDVTQFNWIGSTDQSNRICVAMAGRKVQKAEDLFNQELTVGGTGAGTAISATPVLLRGLLGMKFKLVDGYKGAPEATLAMERGELDGLCNTLSGTELIRPGWIAQGKYNVLFNLEKNPIPGINAPTIYQFLKSEEQRQVVAFFNSNVELGLPFAAPPGVPQDRIEALRKAFDAAVSDPNLVAEAKKMDLSYAPFSGEELKTRIDSLMATPADVIAKTNQLMNAGSAGSR